MLPFNIDLNAKVVAITGGGGVLCSEMGKALAACGAKVAVLDLRPEAAAKVAGEITAAGHQAVAVTCDVLDPASIEAARAEVESACGVCDILINGAGGNHPKGTAAKETVCPEDLAGSLEGSFFDLDPEGIGFVLNLNYLGTVLASQGFARDMARRGHGNIINISSMSAYSPLTKVMSYSGAKAAVSNFTQWLAVHLAPCGVRVNAIAPGFFLTAQNKTLLLGDDGVPTPRCQTILAHTPMRRLGKPEDLIGVLLFLASDAASGFVSGTVLPIDGGFNAFSGV